MTKSSIPVTSAVSRLAETTHSTALRKSLQSIVANVEAGHTLSSAMRQFPEIFSTLFVSLIQVGEALGRLDTAFEHIAQYLEVEINTRKRIKSATRYPMFVVFAIADAMVVINILVIPAFAQMFANFKTELPWATQILIATSDFTMQNWPMLLGATFASFMGIRVYMNTAPGRLLWHRYQLKIPVIGSILERILLARFSRTFALVFKSGVPIHEGISLVAWAMGNDYMREHVLAMRTGISRGESLLSTATNSGLFSNLVLQMLAVGEETGSLDDMLFEVANFYEREVDYDLKRVGDAIEPLLLIIVAAMVLILALGVFLPMWDMVNLGH